MERRCDAFGFGRVTGSGFPGESAGILTGYEHWRSIGQATMAYGYGLSVTPLQLAQAYAVLGAGGIRRPVSLRKVDAPPAGERVIAGARGSRARADAGERRQRRGHRAPRRDHGLPRLRQDRHRVEGLGRRRLLDEQVHGRCSAAWCRRATRASRRVVVIDEPSAGAYYGGDVAAPVFSAVMSGALRLLAIPPDDLQRVPATTLVQAQDPW